LNAHSQNYDGHGRSLLEEFTLLVLWRGLKKWYGWREERIVFKRTKAKAAEFIAAEIGLLARKKG